MKISLRNTPIFLVLLLSTSLCFTACSRRANDAPDPEKSANELQEKADNIANRSRQAVDEAEAALKQSAKKIDESLVEAGATE